jgi:hypothetical protein
VDIGVVCHVDDDIIIHFSFIENQRLLLLDLKHFTKSTNARPLTHGPSMILISN